MRRRRMGPIWLVVGIIGWAGLTWLAIQLYTATPRIAAFDLELLLQAGRDVAAGRSPYDPAMVAGNTPRAADLFYSYPPPVAQVMALFAAIPSGIMLVAWDAAAIGGLVGVAALLTRRFAPDLPVSRVVVPIVCLTPVCFPLAVGLLFGNLDVFFPLLYGLLLLGAVGSSPIRGGAAMAVASVTKLHPASSRRLTIAAVTARPMIARTHKPANITADGTPAKRLIACATGGEYE